MSAPDKNSESARQRDIRLLELLAKNQFVNFSIPPDSTEDMLALKDLISGFYVEAIVANGTIPNKIHQARINTDGREHLQNLKEKESEFLSMPEENEFLRSKIGEMYEAKKTLFGYFKLAGWEDRVGMIFFLLGVFMTGYMCSKIHLISQIIDLIKELKS